MPTEGGGRQQPTPSGDRMRTFNDRAGIYWELAKRGTLGLAVIFVIAIAVHHVVRECLDDRIVFDPVIVKVPPVDGAPTPEMTVQHTIGYMNRMQKSGADEWRQLHLEQEYSLPTSLAIQIPGSSLSLESVVREISSMFPTRRQTLKISITPRTNAAGYVAAIVIVGRNAIRATCESDGTPDSLEKMYECLAIESMSAVDLLFVASYLLSVERAECAKFYIPSKEYFRNAVEAEKRTIDAQRAYCGFPRTRALIATIIRDERQGELVWVPYIFGQVHLARAEALGAISQQAQWYELDRAINRFRELSNLDVVPASALTIQMQAYIKKGITLHESARSMTWSVDVDSPIRRRLSEADRIFEDAYSQLQDIVARRPDEDPIWGTSRRAEADHRKLGALMSYHQGSIRYRQWMIVMHSRTHVGLVVHASDDPAETRLLAEAVEKFELSYSLGGRLVGMFMDWGNTHRVQRKFDLAIERYRQAGDLSPENFSAPLNIAIALLEKAAGGPLAGHYDATRHTSDFLSWSGGGGPYGNLTTKITEALRTTGDAADVSLFKECIVKQEALAAPPLVPDMSHVAALRLCVDAARERISARLVEVAGR